MQVGTGDHFPPRGLALFETARRTERYTMTGVAVRVAREMGIAWLLHIDDDELFFTQHLDVQPHFSRLHAASNLSQAIYLNMEAVPATDEVPGLHFSHVTTFKRNPHVFTREVRSNSLELSLRSGADSFLHARRQEGAKVLRTWNSVRHKYFMGYQVGTRPGRLTQSVERLAGFVQPRSIACAWICGRISRADARKDPSCSFLGWQGCRPDNFWAPRGQWYSAAGQMAPVPWYWAKRAGVLASWGAEERCAEYHASRGQGYEARDVTSFELPKDATGLGRGESGSKAVFEGPYILHYTNIGFAAVREKVASRHWTELNQLTFVEENRDWLLGDLTRARKFYNEVAVVPEVEGGGWMIPPGLEDVARAMLVRVEGPAELISALLDVGAGDTPWSGVCGGEEACIVGDVVRRRRVRAAAWSPVDVDPRQCVLPRCSADDLAGHGCAPSWRRAWCLGVQAWSKVW
jgi:hypothetical protein